MNGRKLQDREYFGLGVAARHTGASGNLYRPTGRQGPLRPENRLMKMPARFTASPGSSNKVASYGNALWYGIFDASYTRPGDYLVTETGTFFIASQMPLLPVLCVLTNRVLAISRPGTQNSIGGNPYGGYAPAAAQMLMDEWPASITEQHKLSTPQADLPSDQPVSYWTVLVPAFDNIALSIGDIISDDLGRIATISGTELTNLGWRLIARMAAT